MPDAPCRWGFISTALIGQKNWQAIKNAGNGLVVGVASRSAERCRRFIDLCQGLCPFEPPPQVYDSYQSLIESRDIDAVYIPLPTGVRKSWVIAAAEAGKHVLCEKPCALNSHDLAEMIEACRRNRVQFMDGVMFMHSRRLPRIREALDQPGSVGDLRRIACQFSFLGADDWLQSDIRTHSDLEPFGCLGDLGWYCIRLALWTMNWTMPQRVSAKIIKQHQRPDSPQAVPLEFSAELLFPGAVSASFYCSFATHHQEWANISGTKGYIQINDFVLPYRGTQTSFEISNADYVVDGCDFYMDNRRRTISVEESGNSAANSMETNLFRCFGDLVLSGAPDYRWADISLKTQQVLDACWQSAREKGDAAAQ